MRLNKQAQENQFFNNKIYTHSIDKRDLVVISNLNFTNQKFLKMGYFFSYVYNYHKIFYNKIEEIKYLIQKGLVET